MRTEDSRLEFQQNNPLGEFLMGDTEQWKRKWQDPNFTHTFPSKVQMFLSDNRHDQFLKEHGNTIIPSAISAFMQLPWDTRDKNSIAVANMAFAKEGKTVKYIDKNTSKTGDTQAGVDSLIKAEIASLILLGFNPVIQEAAKQTLTSDFGKLSDGRKRTFRRNVFDLLTKNSNTRAWIKTNNLDTKNSFVWERDVTKYALSLLPTSYKTGEVTTMTFPTELLNIEPFAPETIEPVVDYMLDFVTNLFEKTDQKTTRPFIKGAERFMVELSQYRGHNIPQEKLDRLSNLVNERQFSIIR